MLVTSMVARVVAVPVSRPIVMASCAVDEGFRDAPGVPRAGTSVDLPVPGRVSTAPAARPAARCIRQGGTLDHPIPASMARARTTGFHVVDAEPAPASRRDL